MNQQADDDLLRRIDRELASWTYAIGHDLTSPLRAIAGFGDALAEDYGDKLEGDGADYLERIRTAATRMQQLIDEFRLLGKVSSGELRRQSVDLSAIAQSIASRLQDGDPERKADFLIATSMTVEGDPALLTIALEHLLGNAWKFTRGVSHARIEVGRDAANASVFFVRDDGAGFDPSHADKLFIPFQRLHPVREFEGVGIGLAVVRRIVHRHGGKTWATGAVDRGATFYVDFPTATGAADAR